MNIVKALAVFGGSATIIGCIILGMITVEPKPSDDKVKEVGWAMLLCGLFMIAGAVVLNENGGLRLS
jgi:hypothetical protein